MQCTGQGLCGLTFLGQSGTTIVRMHDRLCPYVRGCYSEAGKLLYPKLRKGQGLVCCSVSADILESKYE